MAFPGSETSFLDKLPFKTSGWEKRQLCGFATFLLQGVQPGLGGAFQNSTDSVFPGLGDTVSFLTLSSTSPFPPYGYLLVKVSGLQDSFRSCGFSLPSCITPSSGQLLRSYHPACPEG